MLGGGRAEHVAFEQRATMQWLWLFCVAVHGGAVAQCSLIQLQDCQNLCRLQVANNCGVRELPVGSMSRLVLEWMWEWYGMAG